MHSIASSSPSVCPLPSFHPTIYSSFYSSLYPSVSGCLPRHRFQLISMDIIWCWHCVSCFVWGRSGQNNDPPSMLCEKKYFKQTMQLIYFLIVVGLQYICGCHFRNRYHGDGEAGGTCNLWGLLRRILEGYQRAYLHSFGDLKEYGVSMQPDEVTTVKMHPVFIQMHKCASTTCTHTHAGDVEIVSNRYFIDLEMDKWMNEWVIETGWLVDWLIDCPTD